MTLTTPYSATFVIGDGETKQFSYLFDEVSENFISVMVYNTSTGITTIPTFTVDTDQKFVLFGDETPAPTADEVVCIYRNTPEIQDVSFRTLQGYDAKSLENILSKIVAMIQEMKSNYFSTQVLQGDPWQLDLLSSADDGATVNIDYTAKKLVKGLYFRITSGNLQVSADGSNYITMPKSSDVAEFRQQQIELPDHTYQYKLQYRVGSTWYDADVTAQGTADAAYQLAETVQTDLSAHVNNQLNPHQTSVANLTDTQINNPTLGHFLRFDGTKWINSSSDVTSVDWGEIEGDIADQADLQLSFSTKVNIDGTSIMTAPLKFMAGSMRGAVGPYLNGVSFWKLDSQGNLTQIADISDSRFVPTTTNAIDIGSSTKKWKDLYLGGKAYVATLNNGADITVPATGGTLALLSDVPAAQVNSDWNAVSGVAQILNKPTLATVATSGDYNDLLNQPTIPTVGDGTITITQGGTTKGTFTVNQSGDTTIDLDAGGGTSNYHPDLFDWKWADHILNDVQWLRADTFSWQSGSVYEAAFWDLFYDIQISTNWYREGAPGYTAKRYPEVGDTVYLNSDLTTPYATVEAYDSVNDTITANGNVYTQNGNTYVTPANETVAGYTVSVYTGHSGKKITIPSYETAVSNIYSATGVAWYYILDIPNKRFKLPRTKFGVTGLRDTVGNYVAPGLPNITGDILGERMPYATYNGGALYDSKKSTARYASTQSSTSNQSVGFDASLSNPIYGASTTVQPPATQMYLYFYVGEFTQTAIENTAGLNAESFNDKLDLDVGNATATTKGTVVGWGMPDYSAGVTAPSSNTTALTNLYVKGNTSSGNTAHIYINDIEVANGWEGFVCAYVPKGATFRITGVTTPVYYPLIGG